MKSDVINQPIKTKIPNSENLVRNLRNFVSSLGLALSKTSNLSVERALADAVIEKHYNDAKQKAFEMSMGIRSDYWKGH